MTQLTPTSNTLLAPKLNPIIKELNNAELSTKQRKTLKIILDILSNSFSHNIQRCLTPTIYLETTNPYIDLQIKNLHYADLNPKYSHAIIKIPLNTPAKSTINFIGRKRIYTGIVDLDKDVENIIIPFNATNKDSWIRIIDNIYPLLSHNIRTYKYRYEYAGPNLPT